MHLHGGLVPWNSDGGPFSWFTPGAETFGSSFQNPGPEPGTAEYFYPNDQSARLVWYHDHALGITRLNAYAGLASAYILRDDVRGPPDRRQAAADRRRFRSSSRTRASSTR